MAKEKKPNESPEVSQLTGEKKDDAPENFDFKGEAELRGGGFGGPPPAPEVKTLVESGSEETPVE